MSTRLEGLEAQLEIEKKIAAKRFRRQIQEAIEQLGQHFPEENLESTGDIYLRSVGIACLYSHSLTGRKHFRACRVYYIAYLIHTTSAPIKDLYNA